MHQCNAFCWADEHVEVIFTVEEKVTVERVREVLEKLFRVSNINAEIGSIRECGEIDKERALSLMAQQSFNPDNGIVGQRFIREGDLEKIKGFRFSFRDLALRKEEKELHKSNESS